MGVVFEASGFESMNSLTYVTATVKDKPAPLPEVINSLKQHSGNKHKLELSDEEILKGIEVRDSAAVRYIYKKYFKQVRSLVKANSGTSADAEDIFQDAVVILYQKIVSGGLVLNSSLNTYFFSICKYLWLQQLQKRGLLPVHYETINADKLADDQSPELLYEDALKIRLYSKHFKRLSTPDQEFLKMVLNKVPLARIAAVMGYKSYDYAKTRKYLIKEKLKNAIINDPCFREVFNSMPA